jgi:transposase
LHGGGGTSSTMKKKETLEEKAYHLWKKAGLPEFLNRKGPKKTPAWKTYLAYLEYTDHAPAWRRTESFMADYHGICRHWTTWQKAIAKWPKSVIEALRIASIDDEHCEIGAIDGTTLTRSDASQHYLHRIDREDKVGRPVQEVLLVDIRRKLFLSWRIRAAPKGEKCDVSYLIRTCPVPVEGVLMDKGFDSNPLHTFLREQGIWSVAPVRKGCKKGQYRRQLRDCFDWALYWQRSIIESMISAVKRLYGSHVRARNARMQRIELSMRLISYNLRRLSHALLSTKPFFGATLFL